MNISNPRVMLMENIRQSCIFDTYSSDTDTYWNYMMNFSDDCIDIKNPNFTEDCANAVMTKLKLDTEKVNSCIKKEVKSKNFEILTKNI